MIDRMLQQAASRRKFLKSAAALAATSSLGGLSAAAGSTKRFAYVGAYTGAAGGGSNGEGIYRFEMDPGSGKLSQRVLAARVH